MKPPLGLLPPVWMLLAILLTLGLYFALPRIDWIPEAVWAAALPWPWRAVGIVLMVLGAALPIAGYRRCAHHATTIIPFQPPTALVTDGIYARTRNPMYLGMVLMLLGHALLLGGVGPLLVVPAFAIFLDRAFIRREERLLHERFGAAYDAYRQRVRRWV